MTPPEPLLETRPPTVLPGDVLCESPMGRGAAVFSEDGKRRRWLYRLVNSLKTKRMGFVMLNPSTAGAEKDDPTIRRCKGFAFREGAGSMEVANLFDVIATDPRELKEYHRRGELTDPRSLHYLDHVLGCDVVVAAWGAQPLAIGASLLLVGRGARCLGKTRTGAPKHPLYLPANAPLEIWP